MGYGTLKLVRAVRSIHSQCDRREVLAVWLPSLETLAAATLPFLDGEQLGENHFEDMAHLSPVVSSAETFEICRAYHDSDDTEGQSVIENIIGTYRRGTKYG